MIRQHTEQLLIAWASRLPRLAIATQRFYRLVQPRFTVGAVGVLLDDQGRVLLVKHVFHPKTPWGLPGGWVSRNELPQHAVEREFYEETKLKVKAVTPLHIWGSHFWKNHVDMGFAVTIEGTMPDRLELSNELSDYQWTHPDTLPRLLPEHHYIIDLALRRIDDVRQTQ